MITVYGNGAGTSGSLEELSHHNPAFRRDRAPVNHVTSRTGAWSAFPNPMFAVCGRIAAAAASSGDLLGGLTPPTDAENIAEQYVMVEYGTMGLASRGTNTWKIGLRSGADWHDIPVGKRSYHYPVQGLDEACSAAHGYVIFSQGKLSPALGERNAKQNAVSTSRQHAFAAAFTSGAEQGAELAAYDEADPADPEIWGAAFKAISPLAAALPAPLVIPLQLGGVGIEWHHFGINVELRFRSAVDVYAVIEDARGELVSFHGRDPQINRTREALRVLASRFL